MALTKATLIDLNSNELVLDLDADTSITADTDDTIHFKIAGSDEITMTAGAIAPSTSDGNALGTSSLMFSDLFLASGSVVNFNNGDVTLTHASNTLVLAGGSLDVNGQELILDADADTSITADTDDRIDFKIAGVEHFSFSNSSGDTIIKPMVDAKDIKFQQYDGRTLLDINDAGFVGIENGATGPGAIRIFEDTDNGSNYVGLSVGNVSTAYTLVFPNADGSSGQALTTNGSGVLSFTTLSANTPSSADGQALGSASLEWSDLFLADASTIQFGNDQDVVLTHVADTGLLLSGTNVIQFNDASQNIGAPSATVLDINATDEIELNATLVDINANVEISGTATTTGVHTFTAVPVFPNNTIETADIQADAVDGTKIADDAIDSEHYADGSIDNAHIADDAIDSEHYVDGSIDTAHIADLNVTTGKIAADAITGAKIADDAINSEHYTDGSIDTAHIADVSVTQGKIADQAINEAKMQISNAPSNGARLSAQSGNTGGLTWDVNNVLVAFDSVSSYSVLYNSSGTIAANSTQVAGNLNARDINTVDGNTAVSGTWKNMAGSCATDSTSLWQRIS